MANIFIHGLNSKSGGGKSILDNYLILLRKSDLKDRYFILEPNKNEYDKYENDCIEIVDIGNLYKKLYMVYFRYEFILPKLIKSLNIDVIFNLSDVPIKVNNVKQIFLFDWPYAVYPESIIWKKMDKFSAFERKLKLFFFKKYLSFITTMVVQTDTAKMRLLNIFDIKNIKVVPNAVSLENMDGGIYKDFNLPDGIKLLYLCVYFPHKNLEIFISLAKKIKQNNLDYKIIITIESSQHTQVKLLLDDIRKFKLDDIIINIGSVKMENVPSLYKQCNGLLMPTLLESFSGTYVEAMYHKIPIFTSDIDFAHDVCKNSAFYFDPLDSDSILNTIEHAFKDGVNQKVDIGSEILNDFLGWEEVMNLIVKIIEEEKNDIAEEKNDE